MHSRKLLLYDNGKNYRGKKPCSARWKCTRHPKAVEDLPTYGRRGDQHELDGWMDIKESRISIPPSCIPIPLSYMLPAMSVS